MSHFARALVFVLPLLVGATSTQLCAQEAAPRRGTIQKLLEGLDSADYSIRNRSEQSLLKLDEAAPYLCRALPSLSLEARRRGQRILNELIRRRFGHVSAQSAKGRVDLLVEWSGLAGQSVPIEEFWQAVLNVGWGVMRRSYPKDDDKWLWKRKGFPESSYRDFLRNRPERVTDQDTFASAKDTRYLSVRTGDPTDGNQLVSSSLMVSTAPVHMRRGLSSSIVLCLGDVTAEIGPSYCVIITDGEVKLRSVRPGIVVARGRITIKEAYRKCMATIHSESAVRFGFGYDEVGRIQSPRFDYFEGSNIKEKPAADQRLVRFFELSDLGVEVGQTPGALVVRKVQKDGPLGKTGLTVGEEIVAVEDKQTKDAEALRRQLRRAYVLGGAEITVRRGESRVLIDVQLSDCTLPN